MNDPAVREELRQSMLRSENKAYYDLIQDGGRPTHRPSESSFDFLYEPRNYTDLISYWIIASPNKECILETQWTHWQDFRRHQDWRRWRYWKPEWFEKFVQNVRDYCREKGIEGDICLLQNWKEQSRLDDWKEFQYWEYKKADGLVKKMEQAAEAKKACENRLQAAIDEGQAADRIEWINEQGVAAYEARRGTAESQLQREAVLLKWIDEQLPIIASECRTLGICSETQDVRQSSLISTNLGKRERSVEEPAYVKDSSRKVEFADSASVALSPAINTNSRTTKALPQRPCDWMSHQAGLKMSGLAVAERGLLYPAHLSRVSKAQTGDQRARGGKVKLNSPGDKQESNCCLQSRQDEALGKVSTKCTSTVLRARTKRTLVSNLVQRSARISQRPTVHYF